MEAVISSGIEYRRFNHLYYVSKCGKFLRLFKPVSPTVRPDGYLSVGRRQLAHRIVAMVWIPTDSFANHIHHKDGNKQNNHADNLLWTSKADHIRDYHPDTSTGHKMSEAGRNRLRSMRLGSVTSEVTKQKQREASIRLGCKPPPRTVGTKLTQESIALCRANNHMNQSCCVYGVKYVSFSDAGRALGERPHSLRKRCLSKNFPDYQIIND
jgi:hypothetical protein